MSDNKITLSTAQMRRIARYEMTFKDIIDDKSHCGRNGGDQEEQSLGQRHATCPDDRADICLSGFRRKSSGI